MEPLKFSDIADLLNCSRTTHITPHPVAHAAGHWELYEGEHRVHMETVPFKVLYLQSKAGMDEIRSAYSRFRRDNPHVVYASSLDERSTSHHKLLKLLGDSKKIWTTSDYLKSYFDKELDAYKTKLGDQLPEYYIEPALRVPAGMTRKTPNPLFSFLSDVTSLREGETGEIAVLLADPGQGKTTTCQFLASKLCSTQVLPIYISSDQWRSIVPDDLGDLAKTIAHSFRHFGAPISWLEGSENKFLDVTLRAKLFRIVFDGFDEYVLQNSGRTTALETLKTLGSVVAQTGTRIVVTSRTTFWAAELEDGQGTDVSQTAGARVSVYRQEPFDTGKAHQYFKGRVDNQASVDKATQIYERLRSRHADLVGRGFVLNLLADLVERAPGFAAEPTGEGLEWLMTQLCERERVRQTLPITASEQIEALKEFVAAVAQGAEPTSDLLGAAIGGVAERIGSEQRRQCINLMQSHPLLVRPKSNSDRWEVTQEQVMVLLLSRWLIDRAQHKDVEQLRAFSNSAKLSDGVSGDIAETIAQFTRGLPDSQMQVADVIASFLSLEQLADVSVRQPWLRRLATLVALRAVDQASPRGTAHSERAKSLRSYFPAGRLSYLEFTGAIARMDFSGIEFTCCRFENVRWADCSFSESTSFRRCHFVGGSAAYCRHLGIAIWENVTGDEEGNNFVSTVRIADGNKEYTSEDLRYDLAAILNKFIINGGVGLRTVRRTHLLSGPIRVAANRDEILDVLSKHIFEEHHISGTSEKGINIRSAAVASIKFYAANNVFIAPLGLVFDELKHRLCKNVAD